MWLSVLQNNQLRKRYYLRMLRYGQMREGILEETDVLVKNGKISAIGKNISDASATVVDAKGKHLTSGIIDEHSHIAISNGVNEGGHNSSAEVTIQDVVNSEDINIYRELAGGVTTSQLLHGSANPIGGQSAIVKWKWGQDADEMLYKTNLNSSSLPWVKM
jgi:imidazolonepropionase-like amidohydrolase